MNFLLTIASLIFFTTGVITSANSEIPVLIWSPEQSMTALPERETQEALQAVDFHDKYLSPLWTDSKQNAVVFLQDKLHIDDFTKYADVYASDSDGGAFRNVKHLMEDNFSLEIPEVVTPHEALDKLKQAFKGKIYSISSLKEMETLHLSNQEQFMLIVNLDSLKNAQDEEKVISQNDDLIGHVAGILEKNGIKYTAIFTGSTNGGGLADEVEVHAFRHILADSGNNSRGQFMNESDGHIFVFLRDVNLCIKHSSDKGGSNCGININLKPQPTSANGSQWLNKTAIVELSFEGNSTSVLLKFNLTEYGDRWVFENITLSVNSPNASLNFDEANVVAYGVDFTIPLPYSFHCSDLQLYVETVRNSNMSDFKGTYIRLMGFQIQTFMIPGDYFFNAQDCVGFFTTGIWMGLLPVSILIIILVSGTMMLLNLSVTDRFDDPKGKTITVNASE